MSSIKAKFSAIEVFTSNCRDEYRIILDTAREVLARVENYYKLVQQEAENISRQVVRAERMVDTIESKVKSYKATMEQAKADEERYSDEIDYIYDNPITETKTDDDGNETTVSTIDYEALRAATRARDEAVSTYNTYSERYDEAYWVLQEAQSTLSRYKGIKRAIELTAESIQSDIYEIKKYIAAITDEAEYNSRSLQGVLASLSNYLASKAIFLPNGAAYNHFIDASLDFPNKASCSSPTQSNITENEDSHTRIVETTSVEYDIDETALYEGTSGENIEKNIDNYEDSVTYQECLRFAGINGDYETQSKMVSALKEVVENADLSMRVTPEVLSKVLSDGKFKNFFETGTTRGAKDAEGRINSSNYLFGTDTGIKADGFEKFGYLEANGSPEAHEYYPLSQYGGVIIKFKKDSVNATFTCGDSLGFYQHQSNGGIACPITNPSLCSMNKFQMKNLSDAVKNDRVPKSVGELSYLLSNGNQATYFEVQYHGDLRIQDIESVTFISNYVMPSQEVIAQLNDLGIKHDICSL